nr:PilZ domain-containing protein [candidate division Zixibacteria bacterium]
MVQTTAPAKNNPLKVWDKIEIVIDDNGDKGLYVTRIEDLAGQKIIASKPEFVEGNKLLASKARIFVQVKKPDAVYRLPARIEIISGDRDSRVVLIPLGRFERMQRRNFVRIDFEIDIRYTLIKGSDKKFMGGSPQWVKSKTLNISAGGLLVKTEDDVEKDDIIMIRIRGYEEMGVPRLMTALCCRIVQIQKENYAGVEFITSEKLSRFFTATELVSLPDQVKRFDSATQNKLVRYIFDQQVKARQKGLI